jgi:hypothetical protein
MVSCQIPWSALNLAQLWKWAVSSRSAEGHARELDTYSTASKIPAATNNKFTHTFDTHSSMVTLCDTSRQTDISGDAIRAAKMPGTIAHHNLWSKRRHADHTRPPGHCVTARTAGLRHHTVECFGVRPRRAVWQPPSQLHGFKPGAGPISTCPLPAHSPVRRRLLTAPNPTGLPP